MADSSTIPVIIGLDVLEYLTGMAEPQGTDDRAMLDIAKNAINEAHENANSIPYETEGMSKIRRMLKDYDHSDLEIDHFKDCLARLEKHYGFELVRETTNA